MERDWLSRVGWTVALIAGIAAILYWVWPEMPVEVRFVFFIPMLSVIVLAAVWPQRKGLMHGKRPSRLASFFLREEIVSVGFGIIVLSTMLYSSLFPVPSYMQLQFPSYLPSTLVIPILAILEAFFMIDFALRVRRYVESLLPR